MKVSLIILASVGFVCFLIGVIVLIVRTKWRNKVAEARRIADLAIAGEVKLDEHDVKLAIDILQTEWERRKSSGNNEPHEDSIRILKMLDFYTGTTN